MVRFIHLKYLLLTVERKWFTIIKQEHLFVESED